MRVVDVGPGQSVRFPFSSSSPGLEEKNQREEGKTFFAQMKDKVCFLIVRKVIKA